MSAPRLPDDERRALAVETVELCLEYGFPLAWSKDREQGYNQGTTGWNRIPPLAEQYVDDLKARHRPSAVELIAGKISGRLQRQNPMLLSSCVTDDGSDRVLTISFDVDGELALRLYLSWGLPETFTTATGKDPGFHFHHHAPEGWTGDTAFLVEDELDADTGEPTGEVRVRGKRRQLFCLPGAWHGKQNVPYTLARNGRPAQLTTAMLEPVVALAGERERLDAPSAFDHEQELRSRPRLATVVALLGAKRNERGWQAPCPAHAHPGQSQTSLLIFPGDHTEVGLACSAGCTPEAIRATGLLGEVFREAEDSVSGAIEIEPAAIENHDLPVVPTEQSSEGPPTRKVIQFQRLSEFVESAPAEPAWTWRGYLALFALALLAGRPKVGKSTLLMALVAAALRGELFLGLKAKAQGVLILTEERRDTLAEKARILGLVDSEVNVWVVTRAEIPRDTPWPEVVRQAMTFCREHDLDVLVVDTLDRWTGLRGDAENAAGAVNEAMEPLQFAAAAGLAVLAVSHQRKSGGEYGEAVRGSNAFAGSVDVVIELERPSRTLQLGGHARVLRAVSRFSSTPEELFFELGDDGFLPVTDVAAKKADAERSEVLAALELHSSPVSVDDLFEGVDVGKRALRRYLADLLERGLAVRTGAGKKGDPYLWKAAAEREEQ